MGEGEIFVAIQSKTKIEKDRWKHWERARKKEEWARKRLIKSTENIEKEQEKDWERAMQIFEKERGKRGRNMWHGASKMRSSLSFANVTVQSSRVTAEWGKRNVLLQCRDVKNFLLNETLNIQCASKGPTKPILIIFGDFLLILRRPLSSAQGWPQRWGL